MEGEPSIGCVEGGHGFDDVFMTPLGEEEDVGSGERRYPRMDLDGTIFEEHLLRKFSNSVGGDGSGLAMRWYRVRIYVGAFYSFTGLQPIPR